MEKIKWGIIGCGNVADCKGGPALYKVENSELVAVMSRNPGKARDFAEKHKVKKYYFKVEDLLNDNEVNAVYIATPPDSHAELTVKCAKKKKHVLCEKPMAMNVKECENMIKACRKNKVQLMIAYYRRFFPVIQKIKEIIEKGDLGQITFARVQVAGLYVPPENGPAVWRTDPKIGLGGYFVDIASHRIDLLLYLLGEIKEVSAFFDTISYDIKVDDTASALLRFENRAHGIVSANWNIGAMTDELEIAGEKGRLISEGIDKGVLKVMINNRVEESSYPRHEKTHYGLVNDFVKNILSNKQNSLPGEEGIKTSRIIEAAYKSSKKRKVVQIP